MSDELIECFIGFFGKGILHHFHLIKLMTSHHTTFIGAVASCLAAEAGRIADIFFRKIGFGENLISVKRNESRFGGREHIMHAVVGGIGDFIDFIGEFRELTRGKAALILQHMRNQHKFIPVSDVRINEVIEKRPFKPCANAGIDPESASGELCSALIVDQTEVGAEIHVIFRLEIELMRLSEIAERLIIFLSARLQITVGKVGKGIHQIVECRLHLLQLFVVFLSFGGKLLHLSKNRRDILAFLLILRNQLVSLILLCLQRLIFRNHGSALCVERKNLYNFFLCVPPLAGKAFDDFIGIFSYIFDVKHFHNSFRLFVKNIVSAETCYNVIKFGIAGKVDLDLINFAFFLNLNLMTDA